MQVNPGKWVGEEGEMLSNVVEEFLSDMVVKLGLSE
jgi:hypothetical protein